MIQSIYLWYKHEGQEQDCDHPQSTRGESLANVRYASSRERNHSDQNQDKTGGIDESSNVLGVIQQLDLDFACLDGQDYSNDLQECKVGKQEGQHCSLWYIARYVALVRHVLNPNSELL